MYAFCSNIKCIVYQAKTQTHHQIKHYKHLRCVCCLLLVRTLRQERVEARTNKLLPQLQKNNILFLTTKRGFGTTIKMNLVWCNLFQFSCEPSTARACKNCVWGRASWVIGIYCDCLTALLIHHQLRDQCGQSKWSPHHFQFEFTVNKSIIWEMVTSLLSISSGRLLVPWPSWVVRTLLKMECLYFGKVSVFEKFWFSCYKSPLAYLIFVIFLENKIYTEKRQFFALYL